MRVLVTGASGLLGSNLSPLIRARGWTGIGLSRTRPIGFTPWVPLEPSTKVPQIIEQSGVDLVVHCAALASHEACERSPELARIVNAELPARWAASCRDLGAKFIYISSDAVFSGSDSSPYTEHAAPTPTTTYGRSKREGEIRVLEVNEAALVVRTNFFGWSPSGKVGILDYFYQALSTGTQPSGFFDYVTSSIYIPHLARLLWRSAKRDLNGILHLAASTPLSKLDFGRLVALYTGHSPNRVRRKSKASSPLLRTRGENLSLASHRAGRLLEVPMPTTESGIESAVADRAGTLSYFKRFGRWER